MSVIHGSFAKDQRWILPAAIAVALFITVFGIPYQQLLREKAQLAASANAIAHVKDQTKALQQQIAAVKSPSAALALARKEWQLVLPNQGLIQVLPGAGAGSTDPGFEPIVNPGGADLAPSSTTTQQKVVTHSGFLSRFVRTLEFWR